MQAPSLGLDQESGRSAASRCAKNHNQDEQRRSSDVCVRTVSVISVPRSGFRRQRQLLTRPQRVQYPTTCPTVPPAPTPAAPSPSCCSTQHESWKRALKAPSRPKDCPSPSSAPCAISSSPQ